MSKKGHDYKDYRCSWCHLLCDTMQERGGEKKSMCCNAKVEVVERKER